MLNPNILPQIAGGASTTGEMGMDMVAELQKALTAGYGTDVSQLQGGGALRIVLRETEDTEGDQERLRQVINALRDHPGQDAVTLFIRQADGEEVQLALPRARICPELLGRLREAVGSWGDVEALQATA